LERHRIELSRSSLERFARERLRRDDSVALEATTNTWAVVEVIEPYVERVVVANPLRTRAIAEAKVKTDKVDSEVLAQLLRCGYLASVWRPDTPTRQLRELSAHRAALVAEQTRLKNRIHSLLSQRLIRVPFAVLFSESGERWLRQLPFDEGDRTVIDATCACSKPSAESWPKSKVSRPKELSLRGCSTADDPAGCRSGVRARALRGSRRLRRFRDGDHAASYIGLVPSTRQSANICRHGPITKAGNSLARWLLTQAAQHLATHPGPLGVFFRRIARRKHRNVAVVATARKLVVIALLMLKHREPYRYGLPEPTKAKLAAFRIAATQERRKKGALLAPMQRRAPGQRVRKTPGLSVVYDSEGLPQIAPPEKLPAGERRILKAMNLESLPEQLQAVRCRAYHCCKAKNPLDNPAIAKPNV
jgi:transposase